MLAFLYTQNRVGGKIPSTLKIIEPKNPNQSPEPCDLACLDWLQSRISPLFFLHPVGDATSSFQSPAFCLDWRFDGWNRSLRLTITSTNEMIEKSFRFFNSIYCVLSLARVIIGGV